MSFKVNRTSTKCTANYKGTLVVEYCRDDQKYGLRLLGSTDADSIKRVKSALQRRGFSFCNTCQNKDVLTFTNPVHIRESTGELVRLRVISDAFAAVITEDLPSISPASFDQLTPEAFTGAIEF